MNGVELLGWTLIHSLWELALVGLVFGLGLLSIRRPGGRYAWAATALLTCVILPAATGFILSRPAQVVAEKAFPAAVALPEHVFMILLTPTRSEVSDVAAPITEPPNWPQRIAFVWAIGAGIMLLRLGGGLFLLRRRLALADGEATEWAGWVKERAKAFGIRQPIRLLFTERLDSPIVFGWLRGTILFPVELLTKLPAEQIEALLLHELAHLRRHDFLVNVLQSLAEALFFFHPVVWWIGWVLRQERELCCDDLAVAASGNRLTYAHALVSLEAFRASVPNPALGAKGGSLMYRVRRLTRPAPAATAGFAWTPLLVSTAVFVALVGGLAQYPTPRKRIVPPLPPAISAPVPPPPPAAPPVTKVRWHHLAPAVATKVKWHYSAQALPTVPLPPTPPIAPPKTNPGVPPEGTAPAPIPPDALLNQRDEGPPQAAPTPLQVPPIPSGLPSAPVAPVASPPVGSVGTPQAPPAVGPKLHDDAPVWKPIQPSRVTGTVVGIDGRPVAGATVLANPDMSPSNRQRWISGPDGRFTASVVLNPHSETWMWAYKGDAASAVPAVIEDKTVMISLTHNAWLTVVGRAIDSVGRPVAGAPLRVEGFTSICTTDGHRYHATRAEPPNSQAKVTGFGTARSDLGQTLTDSKGFFRLRLLPVDCVQLLVDSPGDPCIDWSKVSGPGQTIDFGTIGIEQRDAIAGTVWQVGYRTRDSSTTFDIEGPVANCVVQVKGHPETRTISDADGAFRLTGLPFGKVTLEFQSPSGVVETVRSGTHAFTNFGLTPDWAGYGYPGHQKKPMVLYKDSEIMNTVMWHDPAFN